MSNTPPAISQNGAVAVTFIPASWDVRYLFAKANTTLGYGYSLIGNGQARVEFASVDYAAVVAAITAYPVAYLEVAVPKKLAEISAERDKRIKQFTIGGMTIPLDDETKLNLDCAALGLMRNEDVLSLDWSLGEGEFVTLPRAVIFAMADGGFRYVQHCFSAHRQLATEAKAAADIDALALVDQTDDARWVPSVPPEAPNEGA